jgi:2',3'-cyclic-nucleotide 2'-phosphodiesterase (5'-nucleotidase family)
MRSPSFGKQACEPTPSGRLQGTTSSSGRPQAANAIGFDVGTLGNHEFDEGGPELMRLVRGGRQTGPEALKRDADGRPVNTSDPAFGGIRFPTVAANTFDREGRLVLPPYHIVERARVRLGFIGVTTSSTPRWLLAAMPSPSASAMSPTP